LGWAFDTRKTIISRIDVQVTESNRLKVNYIHAAGFGTFESAFTLMLAPALHRKH